jgi:mono/diheme cytochrome c family protein
MKPLGLLVMLAMILPAACGRKPAPPPGEPMLNAIQAEQGSAGLSFDESQGRRLFGQYCATCHGDQGQGDGQNASNLQPPPPDLTAPRPGLDAATIRKVITDGSAAIGRSPLSPPLGRNLTGDQIDDLVAYCQALGRKKP